MISNRTISINSEYTIIVSFKLHHATYMYITSVQCTEWQKDILVFDLTLPRLGPSEGQWASSHESLSPGAVLLIETHYRRIHIMVRAWVSGSFDGKALRSISVIITVPPCASSRGPGRQWPEHYWTRTSSWPYHHALTWWHFHYHFFKDWKSRTVMLLILNLPGGS